MSTVLLNKLPIGLQAHALDALTPELVQFDQMAMGFPHELRVSQPMIKAAKEYINAHGGFSYPDGFHAVARGKFGASMDALSAYMTKNHINDIYVTPVETAAFTAIDPTRSVTSRIIRGWGAMVGYPINLNRC